MKWQPYHCASIIIFLLSGLLLLEVTADGSGSGVDPDINPDGIFQFSNLTYNAIVSQRNNMAGDVLFEVGLVYNESVVDNITSIKYTLGRIMKDIVSIDSETGIVTLKKRITAVGIREEVFSVFVIATTYEGETTREFIEATIHIRTVGPVYFSKTSVHVNVPYGYPLGKGFLDTKDYIVKDGDYVIRYEIQRASTYGHVPAVFLLYSDGVLALKELPNPRTEFSITTAITVDFWENGRRALSTLSMTIRVSIQGCPLYNDGNVQWPQMPPCTRFPKNCSEYHPRLHGSVVIRHCDSRGSQSPPDFSKCYIERGDNETFGMLWFQFARNKAYSRVIRRITEDIKQLFPRGVVTDVGLLSVIPSSYALDLIFDMKFLPTINNTIAVAAVRELRDTTHFGGVQLYSNYKGVRIFTPIDECQNFTDDSPHRFIPICQQTDSFDCQCEEETATEPDGKCFVETALVPEDVKRSGDGVFTLETTEFNFLIFRETDKRGDRLGEVIVLKNDSVLNTTSIRYNTRDSSIRLNVHSGVLSVYIASSSSGSQVFYVYVEGISTDGEDVTDFLTGRIEYRGVDRLYFNQTRLNLTIPYDYPLNKEIVDLSTFVRKDPKFNFIYDGYTFSSSSTEFSISLKGSLRLASFPNVKSPVNFQVYGEYAVRQFSRLQKRKFNMLVSVNLTGCQPSLHLEAQPRCSSLVKDCSVIHSWLNGTLVSYCDSDDIREVDFSQCYLTNEDYDILGLLFAKEYNQYWAHSSHIRRTFGYRGVYTDRKLKDSYYITEMRINTEITTTTAPRDPYTVYGNFSHFPNFVIFQQMSSCVWLTNVTRSTYLSTVCLKEECDCPAYEFQNEDKCDHILKLPVAASGCQALYEANVQWPAMPQCSQFEKSCSEYHPLLEGTVVQRHCHSDGEEDTIDFSRCYVQSNVTDPFGLLWFGLHSSLGYRQAKERILKKVRSMFPEDTSLQTVEITSAHYYDGMFRVVVALQFTDAVTPSVISKVMNDYFSSREKIAGLSMNPEYRGIRIFKPKDDCQHFTKSYPKNVVNICQKVTSSDCSCLVDKENVELADSKCTRELSYLPSSRTTLAPYIGLSQSTYTIFVHLSDVNTDEPVYKVPVEVHYPQQFEEYSTRFLHNGRGETQFSVNSKKGVIRMLPVQPGRVQSFSFYVQSFIEAKLHSGEDYHNFTSASVQVSIIPGVSYKGRSQYSVGPDLRKGAVILDMGPNIVQDPKYIKEASVQFSSPDNTDIGITEDGKIYVRNEIQNWQNWFRFTVQVRGIGQKDRKFEWRQDYSVRLNIHSCNPATDNFVTWPRTETCGIATNNCSLYGSIFDDYGTVKRQCNISGFWEKTDFSGCRLKKKEEPGDIALLSFNFAYFSGIEDTTKFLPQMVYDIQHIYLHGRPVMSVEVNSADYKMSRNSYGRFTDLTITFTVKFKVALTIKPHLLFDQVYLNRRLADKTYRTLTVLGIRPKDSCPEHSAETDSGYKYVCSGDRKLDCKCKKSTVLSPSKCCTDDGHVENQGKACNIPKTELVDVPPPTPPPLQRGGIFLLANTTSRSIEIRWTLQRGSYPPHIIIAFASNAHQGHLYLNHTNKNISRPETAIITGLLPSTIYHVVFVGEYPGSDVEPFTVYRTVRTEDDDYPVASFQLLVNGVENCQTLKKTAVQYEIRQKLAIGISNSLNYSRISQLSVECSSAGADKSAILSGWIYGEEGDPAYNYVKAMKSWTTGKPTLTIGDQKLTVNPQCDVFMTSPQGKKCVEYLGPEEDDEESADDGSNDEED